MRRKPRLVQGLDHNGGQVVAKRLILYALSVQRRFTEQLSSRLGRHCVQVGDLRIRRAIRGKLYDA